MTEPCGKPTDPETPFVLFADDDPTILELLTLGAKLRGWSCDTATRAREIIEKVNLHCGQGNGSCYDAIVTDVNFMNVGYTDPAVNPRISGIQAVKDIRNEYPNVPVLFYTGFDTQMVRQQAERAGGEASDFVVKSKPDWAEKDKWDIDGEISRVLDRVEALLLWVKMRNMRKEGLDRRQGNAPTEHRRRAGEGPKVQVSPVIERIQEKVRRQIVGNH